MNKTSKQYQNQVDRIGTALAGRHDDLFLCCTSFEQRATAGSERLAINYRTGLSCIFRFMPSEDEDSGFDEARDRHAAELAQNLEGRTKCASPVTIICDRQNTADGMEQLGEVVQAYYPDGIGTVTLDMSCFTKIYLWELLFFLTRMLHVNNIQVVYTQSRSIPSDSLTAGAYPPSLIPKFAGRFSPMRRTLLLGFVGFEPQRAILSYEEFEPERAELLVSSNPSRPEYFQRALRTNGYLLTRPGVHCSPVHPYDLKDIVKVLEEVLQRNQPLERGDMKNVVLLSLGTKVQNLAGYLFWCRHQEVRLAYSFPTQYARDHLRLQPGLSFAFHLTSKDFQPSRTGDKS